MASFANLHLIGPGTLRRGHPEPLLVLPQTFLEPDDLTHRVNRPVLETQESETRNSLFSPKVPYPGTGFPFHIAQMCSFPRVPLSHKHPGDLKSACVPLSDPIMNIYKNECFVWQLNLLENLGISGIRAEVRQGSRMIINPSSDTGLNIHIPWGY